MWASASLKTFWRAVARGPGERVVGGFGGGEGERPGEGTVVDVGIVGGEEDRWVYSAGKDRDGY